MSALNLKVLISGAGIAGPCLAYWLARTRHAMSITVVERSPSPRVTGQSIDVRGSAIEVVRRMKLEQALRDMNTTEIGTSMINAKGNIFAQFVAGVTFTAEHEVLRADLCEIFLKATESFDNVKYIYGDSIASLEDTEKNVNVTFTNGSKETYDVIVAADGSTSRTRAMFLDPQTLKDSYNFIGQYIAYFSIPSRPEDPKTWQWYTRTPGLSIMLRPHRHPSKTLGAYLVITTPAHGHRFPDIEEAINAGPEAQKRIFHKYLDDAGWQAKRVLDGMDQADDFYMSRAAQVKLPRWTSGRCAAIGDAAYATFGVGTSLAIQSGYFLAGELSKVRSKEEVPRALERYEEMFRPVYKEMEELPLGYPQMFWPQTGWALWLRDSFLWVVSATQVYRLFGGRPGSFPALPEYDWKEV